MAAAVELAEAGILPTVLDSQTNSGGQIWRGVPRTDLHRTFNQRVVEGRIRLVGEASVVDAKDSLLLTTQGAVAWDRLILATGARELFLPFSGWTLPGVMGAGGLQAAYKAGLKVKGKRIVVAGSGPLLLAVAAALKDAGADVSAICEQAAFGNVLRFGLRTVLSFGKVGQALDLGIKTAKHFHAGTWITKIEPGLRVSLSDGRKLEADLVGAGYGLVPNLELPRLLGCRIQDNFVAVDYENRTSRSDIWAAGEITSIGGVDAAVVEGRLAARSALALDSTSLRDEAGRWRAYASAMMRAYALRDDVKTLAQPDTLVCRCEAVRRDEVLAGMEAVEAKLDLRLGMGWCQGRICGAACRELFGWSDPSIRPPLFPMSSGQYANLLGSHDES